MSNKRKLPGPGGSTKDIERLARRILQDAMTAGNAFPTDEAALADRYDVPRPTITRTIAWMQVRGYIERA